MHPRNVAFAKLPRGPKFLALLGIQPASQATPGGAVRRSGLDFIRLSCNIELQYVPNRRSAFTMQPVVSPVGWTEGLAIESKRAESK
jgi:hypothetical protein